MINFDKLIKLMNLTTSDNDHESLMAIRKANQLIKSSNSRWENILSEKEDYSDTKRSISAMHMVNFIYANSWNNFDYEFIDNIHKKLQSSIPALSEKQMAALKNIYRSVGGRF